MAELPPLYYAVHSWCAQSCGRIHACLQAVEGASVRGVTVLSEDTFEQGVQRGGQIE